jgi:uncharacterized membrane protein YeiB
MVVAHLASRAEPIDWTVPATWVGVADGRPSTLFAVVAGISVALVTARARRSPADVPRARASSAVRGAVVGAFGLLLVALPSGVAIILPVYGLLFLLVALMVTWPVRRVVALSIVLAVAAPLVHAATVGLLAPVDTGPDLPGRFAGVLLQFPPVSYAAYLAFGLAIGRGDLRSPRSHRLLLAGGTAAATLAYLAGGLLAPEGVATGVAAVLFSPAAYGNSWVDVVGTTGVAVALVAASLLVADRVPSIARPLAVVGAMPLTAYTLHVVVLVVVLATTPGSWITPAVAGATLAATLVGTWLFASLWSRRHPRGPLEAALATVVGRLVTTTSNRREPARD